MEQAVKDHVWKRPETRQRTINPSYEQALDRLIDTLKFSHYDRLKESYMLGEIVVALRELDMLGGDMAQEMACCADPEAAQQAGALWERAEEQVSRVIEELPKSRYAPLSMAIVVREAAETMRQAFVCVGDL